LIHSHQLQEQQPKVASHGLRGEGLELAVPLIRVNSVCPLFKLVFAETDALPRGIQGSRTNPTWKPTTTKKLTYTVACTSCVGLIRFRSPESKWSDTELQPGCCVSDPAPRGLLALVAFPMCLLISVTRVAPSSVWPSRDPLNTVSSTAQCEVCYARTVATIFVPGLLALKLGDKDGSDLLF